MTNASHSSFTTGLVVNHVKKAFHGTRFLKTHIPTSFVQISMDKIRGSLVHIVGSGQLLSATLHSCPVFLFLPGHLIFVHVPIFMQPPSSLQVHWLQSS